MPRILKKEPRGNCRIATMASPLLLMTTFGQKIEQLNKTKNNFYRALNTACAERSPMPSTSNCKCPHHVHVQCAQQMLRIKWRELAINQQLLQIIKQERVMTCLKRQKRYKIRYTWVYPKPGIAALIVLELRQSNKI
jgi:hypothetical protein